MGECGGLAALGGAYLPTHDTFKLLSMAVVPAGYPQPSKLSVPFARPLRVPIWRYNFSSHQ
jgi:hypothetical protein